MTLDYADQRYYASNYGRFNTVDPLQSSAKPNNPGSWNRYAYVGGDPVNLLDPRGMEQSGCGSDWVSDPSLAAPCCLPGSSFAPDPSVSAACYTGSGDDEEDDDSSGDSSAPPPCDAAVGLTADQTKAVETVMGENSYWLLGHQSYLPGNTFGAPSGPTITTSMVYTEDVDMFSVFVNRTQSSQFPGTTIGAVASQKGQFLAYSNGTGLAKFNGAVSSTSGSSPCDDLTDVIKAMNFVLAKGSQLASNYLYWKGIVQPGRHLHPARAGDIYVAGTVFETSN